MVAGAVRLWGGRYRGILGRLFRPALYLTVALAVLMSGIGAVGYVAFTRASYDPARPVDAVIVLGGERDGREEYGLELARQGLTENVVLSDPYSGASKGLARLCATKDPRFKVTCVPPVPATTRGEAIFTRELATKEGWDSVLVISWRYHLPRVRYIFSQCFDGKVFVRPVPREYEFSPIEWEYIYVYQIFGFAKAVLQGDC